MAETSGFFDAELISDEEGYDRVYVAEQFANYFALFVGNGVFSNSNMLQVLPNTSENMSVVLKSGWAWINGLWYHNDSDKVIKIDVADGTYSRYDAIVVRLDVADRMITSVRLVGEYADKPKKPVHRRDGDYFDLVLAYISIPKGTVKITNDLIIDMRLDKTVCGQVEALIEQPDVSEYGAQLNEFIENYIVKSNVRFDSYDKTLKALQDSFDALSKKFQNESEADFNTWFDSIKGKLGEDAATNLQLQIDDINADIEAGVDIKTVKENNPYIEGTVEAPMLIEDFTRNILNATVGTKEVNGITFTKNEDGTFTVNGTATADAALTLGSIDLEEGKTYTLSGCPSGGGYANTYCLYGYASGSSTRGQVWDIGLGGKIEAVGDKTKWEMQIVVFSGYTIENVVFKPMIEVGEVKHNYVPYKGYTITSCGKNILKPTLESSEKNGITCTKLKNGLYKLNGTASLETSFAIVLESPIVGDGELKRNLFIISGECSDTLKHISYDTEWKGGAIKEVGSEEVLRNGIKYVHFRFTIPSGSVCSDCVIGYIVSKDADTFEEYKGTSIDVSNSEITPVYGLKSYEGVTNVITTYGANLSAQCAISEHGKCTMDSLWELHQLNVSMQDLFVAVLASKWVKNSDGLYVNTIQINGVTESDSPIYGLHSSSDIPTDEELIAYMKVESLIAHDNYVEIIAKDKPITNFTIVLKGTGGKGASVIANFDEVVGRLSELEAGVSGLETELETGFATHKNSGDHDGRYYTETEVNTLLGKKAPTSHASTGTGYGIGNLDKWGHIRLVNDFTHTSFKEGYGLSSYGGYLLKQLIDTLNGIGTIGSAFRFYGTSSENYTYGCYNQGIYTITGAETGIPEADYPGYMLTLRHSNAHIVKIALLVNCHVHVMGQGTDGIVVSNWRRLAVAGVDC